jgi:hypothetical protein
MDNQIHPSKPDPLPLCLVCLISITEGEADISHTHHDAINCSWEPEDNSSIGEIMAHELFCSHQLHYHQECCPKCSNTLVGV